MNDIDKEYEIATDWLIRYHPATNWNSDLAIKFAKHYHQANLSHLLEQVEGIAPEKHPDPNHEPEKWEITWDNAFYNCSTQVQTLIRSLMDGEETKPKQDGIELLKEISAWLSFNREPLKNELAKMKQSIDNYLEKGDKG